MESLTEFRAALGLVGIEIPTRVKEIGAYAFWGCGNLQRAVFFESATWAIGEYGEELTVSGESTIQNAQLLRSVYAACLWRCVR